MTALRRPLVAALIAFLLGLLSALRFPLPLALVVPLFVVVGAGLGLARSRPDDRWLLLALFGLSGAVVGSAGRAEATGDCRHSLRDGARLSVQGTLAAAHRRGAAGSGAPLLPLERTRVSGPLGCSGDLRVRMPPGEADLPPGSHLTLIGAWRTFAPRDDASPWPRDPRYLGFLAADSLELHSAAPPHVPLSLRARTDAVISELFPQHLPIVEALLLGRREYVDSAVTDRYARAGLSHLLAISGMHVGLFASMLVLVCAVARLPRRFGVAATLTFTWIYLLVIGAPPSALRAGVMLTIGLSAALLQRPAAAAAAVAAAALVICAVRPLSILEPGFQLSFMGVLGLLALRRPIVALLPVAALRRPKLRATIDAFAVGVAAFLATAPVVAHHFGVVAPVSMLAGVPAAPLLSLALVGITSAIALNGILPGLATILADGAAAALDLLDLIALRAATLPFGHLVVAPPPWWMWLAAAAAGLVATRSVIYSSPLLRRAAGSGAALAIVILWPLAGRGHADGLEVHFIDVGQGDAIAIRTPDFRWILVDAGPASDLHDAGARRVVPFLRGNGARHLDALVLTHPDLDHIGGAAAVLREIRVRHIFEPGLAVGREPYLELLHTLADRDVDWRAARTGRALELDGVRFDFLWPDAETIDGGSEVNDISAILRVSYGEFTLLLTGDAGADVERLLVERHGSALEADVLKLGHHGSATSSADVFLDTVRPRLAVVSAGRRNRYGHPAPSVVRAVEEREIAIARTDREGTISLRVDPGGAIWAVRD